MKARRTIGYAAVSGLTCVVAWMAGVAAGLQREQAGLALAAAWLVQMVAFVPLARRLAGGKDATAAWLGGIILRGGAVLAAWPLAALGLVSRSGGIVFGLGLAALIVTEAVWLATIPPLPGSNDR